MARNGKLQKKRKPAEVKGGRVRRGRPKVCIFCAEHIEWVDYKDTNLLRRFINDRGRIKARGATGTCAQHQRDVAVAIKTARELVMLPYVVRTVTASLQLVDRSLEEAAASAEVEILESLRSEDFKEGVAHFAEKRAPRFTGR